MIKYRARIENIIDSLFRDDDSFEDVNLQSLKNKIYLLKSKILDDEFVESDLKLLINERLPDSKVDELASQINIDVDRDIPLRVDKTNSTKFYVVITFLSLFSVLNVFLFFRNNMEVFQAIVWHNLIFALLFGGASLGMYLFVNNRRQKKNSTRSAVCNEERRLLARKLLSKLLENEIYTNSYEKGA